MKKIGLTTIMAAALATPLLSYDVAEAGTEVPVGMDNEVDLNQTPDGGRPYIPTNRYTAVIVGAQFGQSKSSGNNMITLEFEVVAPKLVIFKGEEYPIEGTKITEYLSLQPHALSKLKALHTTLKLPAKVNLNNPDTNVYLGKALSVVISTRQKVMAVEGTTEPILGADGKPLSTNEYRIDRYLVAAPEHNRSVAF